MACLYYALNFVYIQLFLFTKLCVCFCEFIHLILCIKQFKINESVVYLSISYDKLFDLLKQKGYTTYRIRKENLIGQGTLTALRNGTGGLDAKTIDRICRVLECQPGDIMEYIPEEQNGNKQGET